MDPPDSGRLEVKTLTRKPPDSIQARLRELQLSRQAEKRKEVSSSKTETESGSASAEKKEILVAVTAAKPPGKAVSAMEVGPSNGFPVGTHSVSNCALRCM